MSPEKDKIFFVFPRAEVNPFLRTSCQILLGNGTAGMNNFIYLFIYLRYGTERSLEKNERNWDVGCVLEGWGRH